MGGVLGGLSRLPGVHSRRLLTCKFALGAQVPLWHRFPQTQGW